MRARFIDADEIAREQQIEPFNARLEGECGGNTECSHAGEVWWSCPEVPVIQSQTKRYLQTDDRPLIIDQPEENLDPKSIFVELVGRFVESRRRRQIIIVTQNANLVVNTDADQVIIASSGPHRPGGLPEISYLSGGLENPVIREEVCEILEGGKPAFEERARRLRIRLP